MSNIYRNLTYITITLLTYCIAVYLYAGFLVNHLGFYNKYAYQNSLFTSTIEFLIFLGLSTFFLQKIIQKKWRILVGTFLYLIVLLVSFFNIAFSLRAEFGATWTNMELLFELVLFYKKTLPLLSVTAIIYYILLKFLRNEKI